MSNATYDRDAFVTLMKDTFRGQVKNYSKEQASDVIRKQFIEIIGTDKLDHRTFRDHAPKVFSIVEVVLDDVIIPSIIDSPFFNQFVEYRDLNIGDTNEFYVEDRTMLTISKIADGHIDLRRQKLNIGQSFTVQTSTYGAKVYGDFLRFVTGRLDWAGLVAKIEQAFRHMIAQEIYTAFAGSAQYLPSQFTSNGTFNEADFDRIVQQVQTINGYKPVVVAGTRTALKKINGAFNTNNSFLMSWDMANQINSNVGGLLNQYQGIPLLEIPQVYVPNTFNFALDDTKLFILPAGAQPIKFVREGQSMIRETSQGNMDMSIEHTFLTKFGIAVIFNVAYGVMQLA